MNLYLYLYLYFYLYLYLFIYKYICSQLEFLIPVRVLPLPRDSHEPIESQSPRWHEVRMKNETNNGALELFRQTHRLICNCLSQFIPCPLVQSQFIVVFMGSTPRGGRGFFHVCALWQYTCLTLLPTVRWRYRRHVAQLVLLTSCYLDWEGGGGGMITFLSTVRWRYRRHVAQLCCWLFTTLTGRGGGGAGGGW